MNFWIVRVTDAMRQAGAEYQRQIFATGLTRTPNYTGLSVPNRFSNGHVGELTFEVILIRGCKHYVYRPHADGKPDKRDFLLFNTDRTIQANVKASGRGEQYTDLWVAAATFERHHADIYVGGQIIGNLEYIRFDGWAWRSDFDGIAPSQRLIPTLIISYPRSMDSLWELIK